MKKKSENFITWFFIFLVGAMAVSLVVDSFSLTATTGEWVIVIAFAIWCAYNQD